MVAGMTMKMMNADASLWSASSKAWSSFLKGPLHLHPVCCFFDRARLSTGEESCAKDKLAAVVTLNDPL